MATVERLKRGGCHIIFIWDCLLFWEYFLLVDEEWRPTMRCLSMTRCLLTTGSMSMKISGNAKIVHPENARIARH